MYQKYWRFFWPLALTGLTILLARQFRNGALSRYPEATYELAIFAVATSLIFVFSAAQLFLPQMSNLFDRSPDAHRVCIRFTIAFCVILTLPLVFLGATDPGREIIMVIFNVEGDALDAVTRYIRLLSPLVLLLGLQRYYTGLLIQNRQTVKVTLIHCVYLASVIAMLIVGFQSGWKPFVTLTLAQLVPSSIHLLLTYWVYRNVYVAPEESEQKVPTYRAVFEFFWPAALTSLSFALSRPTIYSFVSHTPNAIATIAALRITFDLSMIFRSPINEFRHLFVTFGERDLPEARRFMFWIIVVITGIMILVAATPLSIYLLHDLLGVSDVVLSFSLEIFWILCLMPFISGARNYFHSVSLLERRTRGMGGGGVFRLLITYGLCQLTYQLGYLDHQTAALIFVFGFLGETMIMVIYRKFRTPHTKAAESEIGKFDQRSPETES